MKYPTRFRVLRGWKLLVADLGLQPAHVLALAQLPADLFGRPDATVTAPEFFALWRAVDDAAGTVVYTPEAGYTGADSFAYLGYDGTNEGTVISTVSSGL